MNAKKKPFQNQFNFPPFTGKETEAQNLSELSGVSQVNSFASVSK